MPTVLVFAEVHRMLDGIWVPIEAEVEGAPLPAAFLQGTRLTIQGVP